MKMRICEIMQQAQYLTEEQIKTALNKKCIKQYAYILHNKDVDENGNPIPAHWHIMLQFHTAQDSKYICKWFEIEEQYVNKSKSGRFKSMLSYLIHANAKGKYQYSADEVKANFNYEQFIEEPDSEEELEVILQLINDGFIREYNYTDFITPKLYIKHKDKIKTALEYRRDRLYDGNRNLEVIYLQGCSGCGKTTYAKHLATHLGYSFFISSSDNDLLDGYRGQECIILDDLRGSSIKLTDLLKLLDNNTDSLAKSRFHNKVLSECKLIIITTVVDMDNFYKTVFESSDEPIEQFKRRIRTYIIMDKKYMRVGQYSNEKQTYEFEKTVFKNPLNDILKNSTLNPIRTEKELQDFLSIKPIEENTIPVPF